MPRPRREIVRVARALEREEDADRRAGGHVSSKIRVTEPVLWDRPCEDLQRPWPTEAVQRTVPDCLRCLFVPARRVASRDIHGVNGSHVVASGGRTGPTRHRDTQFAAHGAHALEDAAGRRHVCVVAADRDADVPILGDRLLVGIESHPAEIGQKHFDPGMRGAVGRAILAAGSLKR